jgi:hypothetical protein
MAAPVLVEFTTIPGPPGLIPVAGAQEGDLVLAVVILDQPAAGTVTTHLFGRRAPAAGFLANTQNVAAAVRCAAILLRD